MQESIFYKQLDNNTVQCTLCPRNCVIEVGKVGNCNVRLNYNGVLNSVEYGRVSSYGVDPVEKKPLYHFYPSKELFSIGTVGCNLHCSFCQNHTISQCKSRKSVFSKTFSPANIVKEALQSPKVIGVAYTFNEPTVFYEYMLDTAKLVHESGLKNVMVSNGYINPEPLDLLLPHIDAFNIDLKAFTPEFYLKYTKATLEPVKETIKRIADAGVHLEITNLVIPSINDDEDTFERMCEWIAREIGENTVLHLSRFFPNYTLNQYPTPPEILFSLYDISKTYLKNVYVGNYASEHYSNTYCHSCGNKMVERTYYNVKLVGIDSSGKCTKCGNHVIKYM